MVAAVPVERHHPLLIRVLTLVPQEIHEDPHLQQVPAHADQLCLRPPPPKRLLLAAEFGQARLVLHRPLIIIT